MLSPDVSVIVPVYNAKEYLSRCLDSITGQTLHNWELMLIDDGSTDGSGAICDVYAAKDSRIRVIHQENAGVSVARNTGLCLASGKYIGFVDADDRIADNMFKALFNAAESGNYSVVMCDAVTIYTDGKKIIDTITQLSESTVLKKGDINPNLLLELAGSVWRCLYSRELIEEYEILFPTGLKFSEDRVFNILCIGYSDKINYLKEPYYFRHINSESAVHRFHGDYFDSCLLASVKTENAVFKAWNNDNAIQTAYLKQLIDGAKAAICNCCYKTSPMSVKERRAEIMRICQNSTLRDAIQRYGSDSIYTRMIMKKNVEMLSLYAKLANLKHGR